jgi:hypothetical protein
VRHPALLCELEQYIYGLDCFGDKGMRYNPERCGYEIWTRGGVAIQPHQCQRKKSNGTLYCKKHRDLIAEEAKYAYVG